MLGLLREVEKLALLLLGPAFDGYQFQLRFAKDWERNYQKVQALFYRVVSMDHKTEILSIYWINVVQIFWRLNRPEAYPMNTL